MSSALAIAAVSASLRQLLSDGLAQHDLSSIGSFSVTSLPPDRITTGATEANQLNLFLYQVSANPGWRNTLGPTRDMRGTRIAAPPLALDLHFLLSAYGAQELNADVLFGYALQVLHERPLLSREFLRDTLDPPGPFGNLSAVDLADQVELIKITPLFPNAEDLSKLWTALQARYRPSMAYLVTVVLIQDQSATRVALPVLARGEDDRGPVAGAAGVPLLGAVRPALSPLLPAARLGDLLRLACSDLPAGARLALDCARLALRRELPLLEVDGQPAVRLPAIAEDADAMHEWAIGVYSVAAFMPPTPTTPAWLSNAVPLAVAPLISATPLLAAAGDLALSVTCTPRLRDTQLAGVRLLFGSVEVAPSAPIVTPNDPLLPSTLQFSIAAVAAGEYPLRLRVDAIDSLPVSLAGAPAHLVFDPQQTVRVT